MKLGYMIWSMGWVCIAVGGMLIGIGIAEGMWFGIIRGLLIIGVYLVWFRWGKGRIQKALMK